MENFIEDQIKRNIANRVFIEKSMGKDISDESCLDVLEKAGKKAQIGEVRVWSGKEYIKTPAGWLPKSKVNSTKTDGGNSKLEADKEKKDVPKNLSSRKKEISAKIRELNKLSKEVERLEDLMYDDDYDADDELDAELEWGDEYEKVSEKFDKAARETRSMIKKFMKDVDPKFKAPKGADVWELIEIFKKVKP